MAKIKAVNLKWRNKYSGEEGFVKTVSTKNKCFYNTFDKSEAKTYTSDIVLNNEIEFLKSVGESKNNDFFTVEA